MRALLTTLVERKGEDTAREVGQAQWIGSGFAMSRRLKKAMAISGDGAEAILKVLQLHPAFQPSEYIHLGFELTSDRRGRFWIENCDALNEEKPWSWFALLGNSPNPALGAMVQAVNPRARCIPVNPSGSGRLAWDVVVDADAEPATEPKEVGFARISNTWDYEFTRRRPLRT